MANDVNGVGQPVAVMPMAPAGAEPPPVGLRELFELVRSGKWTILAAAAAALALAGLYVFLATPIYTADGLVQVEQDKSSSMLSNLAGSDLSGLASMLMSSPAQTEAEIQILQSRMVLDQVIDQMNLLVQAKPRYFPLIGAALARWHRRAVAPVAPFLGLSHFAWGGERLDLPRLDVPDSLAGEKFLLRATAGGGYQLEGPDGDSLLAGQVGEAATATTSDGPVTIFVRELNARPGTEFHVVHQPRAALLGALSNALMVEEEGENSGVIGIKFKGPSPDFVTSVIDHLEDAYLRQNVERRSAEAQQSLEFLSQQLPELKAHLQEAQSKLSAYQLQHGSVDVSGETEGVLQSSESLETSRLQLEEQRQEALQRFTPEHPVVKALDAQIKSVEGEQGKLEGRMNRLPTTQQEILGLLRDVDVDGQLYSAMLNSAQQMQVAKAGTVGDVRIVDHALKPLKPSAPKSGLILALAAFLGLFLGTVFVFVQRALLRGVDDPAVVENRLGLPAYAMIPYTPAQHRLARQMDRGRPGNHLLAAIANDDVAIEALRSLRSSLSFLMLESPNNILMLTGPTPGLGKSFVAINLGAVLALAGKRVAVVDVDMRRGHLHRYTSLAQAPGLSDFIAGSATAEQVLRTTVIDGLQLVTNGTHPPNPAELLMHPRFAELVRGLSQKFDYVILDTPPALLVADAGIVGRIAGCALLVLQSAEHPMREIEESQRRLLNAGVKLQGTIFNQVGQRMGSYGYGGYGFQYSRYHYGES